MSQINLAQTPLENVKRLLGERNPDLIPYLEGVDLSAPIEPEEGAVTTKNTQVTVTAQVGSGLQPGTAGDYYYDRLTLETNATKGTFTGTLYVRPEENEGSVIDQLVLEAGLHRAAVDFSDYVPIDDQTETPGSITVTPIDSSPLYIGELIVVLERYIPTVQDVAPSP